MAANLEDGELNSTQVVELTVASFSHDKNGNEHINGGAS